MASGTSRRAIVVSVSSHAPVASNFAAGNLVCTPAFTGAGTWLEAICCANETARHNAATTAAARATDWLLDRGLTPASVKLASASFQLGSYLIRLPRYGFEENG